MASSAVLLLRHVARRLSVGVGCQENITRSFYNLHGLGSVALTNKLTALPTKPLTSTLWFREMSKDSHPRSKKEASSSDSESNSDREGGKKRERGTSDFWRLKMRTLHSVFDINKDGVVSYDDFRIMADRFIKLGNLKPYQQVEFRKTIKGVWEEQWGSTDDYNLVNAHQYLDNMYHVVNDKNLRKKVHYFLPYLFRAVDKDGSGEISVEEFKLFFKCLGLKEEDAVASFRVIDVNHDNCLSEKEFIKFGKQYFITEKEEKPSRVFWGPLASDH